MLCKLACPSHSDTFPTSRVARKVRRKSMPQNVRTDSLVASDGTVLALRHNMLENNVLKPGARNRLGSGIQKQLLIASWIVAGKALFTLDGVR